MSGKTHTLVVIGEENRVIGNETLVVGSEIEITVEPELSLRAVVDAIRYGYVNVKSPVVPEPDTDDGDDTDADSTGA